jgi:hypothetical protein
MSRMLGGTKMEAINLAVYTSLYPNAEIIDSSQIFKGMKFHAIRPGMLSREGEAIPYICRKKGDTLQDAQEMRIVIFNRDYAVAKLAADTARFKHTLSSHDWEALMSAVYHHE